MWIDLLYSHHVQDSSQPAVLDLRQRGANKVDICTRRMDGTLDEQGSLLYHGA